MIKISSEAELLSTFRPIDREEVILTDKITFPILLTDYVAWVEPSGHRVYLVFQDPSERGGAAWGVVFKRSQGPGDTMQMCQWCHSVRGGRSVSLLTAAVTPKNRIGVHVCSDLSCKDKVLGLPGVNDLREPYSRFEKLFKVLYRMSDFVRYSLLERNSGAVRQAAKSTRPVH